MKMQNPTSKPGQPSLVKMVMNLFTRLTRPSDDYPVKYYKRDRQFSRSRN